MAQQLKSGLDRLVVEVSKSHTIRHTRARARTYTYTHTHTHRLGLLWTSDQPVAEAATYTTHKRTTSMPSEGSEPAIPAIKRLQQTRALDHPASGIGLSIFLHVL